MKLTIITGPQGSGKTAYLKSMLTNNDAALLLPYRLASYPIHLPGLTPNIKTICFDEVRELYIFYLLAAIAAKNEIFFRRTTPGLTEIRNDLDVIVSTLIPKKQLAHIYKGLPNVSFKELGSIKKKKGYTDRQLPEENNTQ